jgi:predicted nucleotidyltransferase
MDTAIKSELDTLKEIIIRTVPVEQIWLFGSYAYGTPNKDSDLDLYVVLRDDVEMRLIDIAINIRIAIGRKKQCLLMLLRTPLVNTRNAPVSRHWNGL